MGKKENISDFCPLCSAFVILQACVIFSSLSLLVFFLD